MTRAVPSSPAGQIAQRLDKAIPLLWRTSVPRGFRPGFEELARNERKLAQRAEHPKKWVPAGVCDGKTRPARGCPQVAGTADSDAPAGDHLSKLPFQAGHPLPKRSQRRDGRLQLHGCRGSARHQEAANSLSAAAPRLPGSGRRPPVSPKRIQSARGVISFALFRAQRWRSIPEAYHCRFRMMLQGRGRGSETKPIAPAAPSERAVRVFSARRSSTPAVIAQI